MKKFIVGILVVMVALVGCSRDAQVASSNLSKDSDNFKILRRIIFYNGITDTYILTIEGYCSKEDVSKDNTLRIICKTSPTEYKKHFLGLSDNVTYFIEQLEGANVSVDHYKVIFKPSVVIPEIEMR